MCAFFANEERTSEVACDLLEEAKESHEKTSCKARLFSEDVYRAGSWVKKRRVI